MPTFEELVEKLTDETASYSRRSAISALGRLGDERAVEPLVSALQDEDRYIRREAAKALGELGSPVAIEPLIAALGDPEESVRRNAIIALGATGDESAVEPLKQILEDKSYFIRSEAEKSIRAIEEHLQTPAPVAESAPEPEPVPPPPTEPEPVEETPPPAEPEAAAEAPVQEDIAHEEPEVITSKEERWAATREEVRKETSERHAAKAQQIISDIEKRDEQRDLPCDLPLTRKTRSRRIPWPVIAVAIFIALRLLSAGRIVLAPMLLIGAPIVLLVLWRKWRDD